MGPLRAAGLGEIEATLVVKSAVALLADLIDRWRRDEIEREAAIEIGQRALTGLITGLVAGLSQDPEERG